MNNKRNNKHQQQHTRTHPLSSTGNSEFMIALPLKEKELKMTMKFVSFLPQPMELWGLLDSDTKVHSLLMLNHPSQWADQYFTSQIMAVLFSKHTGIFWKSIWNTWHPLEAMGSFNLLLRFHSLCMLQGEPCVVWRWWNTCLVGTGEREKTDGRKDLQGWSWSSLRWLQELGH